MKTIIYGYTVLSIVFVLTAILGSAVLNAVK